MEANKNYEGQEIAKMEKLPKMSWSPEVEGESCSLDPVGKVETLRFQPGVTACLPLELLQISD